MAIILASISLIIAIIAFLMRRADANLNQRVAILECRVSRLWHIETLLRQIKKKRREQSDVSNI